MNVIRALISDDSGAVGAASPVWSSNRKDYWTKRHLN